MAKKRRRGKRATQPEPVKLSWTTGRSSWRQHRKLPLTVVASTWLPSIAGIATIALLDSVGWIDRGGWYSVFSCLIVGAALVGLPVLAVRQLHAPPGMRKAKLLLGTDGLVINGNVVRWGEYDGYEVGTDSITVRCRDGRRFSVARPRKAERITSQIDEMFERYKATPDAPALEPSEIKQLGRDDHYRAGGLRQLVRIATSPKSSLEARVAAIQELPASPTTLAEVESSLETLVDSASQEALRGALKTARE